MATTTSKSLFLLCCVFLTVSHATDSLRFFVIGDMGGIDTYPYSTYYERSTAAEMGKLAELYAPQFILELGDNFYYEGVKNLQDKRFKETFEDIYTAKSLQVPWYLVAGNHDHNGNVTAQIEYSKVSKRWNYPSLYYYLEFAVGSGGQKIGFVMMDTIQLCGNTDDFKASPLMGPENVEAADSQWDFVRKTLNSSKAEYLFSAGHYPIYSIAEHGPTPCLVSKLLPMLDEYGANGHMSGHDHNLQHLRTKSSKGLPIDHIVSGMANFIDGSTLHKDFVPKGSSLFHNAHQSTKGGFLYAEVTSTNMTLTYIGANGNHLYTTNVYPRKI